MLGRVALVRTDVSEERSAYIIRVTRIGELGFLQEPHGVTSKKTAFFNILTAHLQNIRLEYYR
jgi:hypothetical protein